MEFFTENVDALRAAAWFLSGAVIYRFLARTINYVQLTSFVQQMNQSVLSLVASTLEDFGQIVALKYKLLKESGLCEKDLALVKSVDEGALENWKRQIVSQFLNTYPKEYYGLLGLSDKSNVLQLLTGVDKKKP